ncbi:MAG: hypothetical protein E7047_08310 [Lentisphaerae bacterium]|nr:hypothetical protein [Lentisphaerota bacterium]
MELKLSQKTLSGTISEIWQQLLQVPANYTFKPRVELIKTYEFTDYTAELYLQANGPGTVQRVIKTVPRDFSAPLPAVAAPFYYPEAMLGFDPETMAVEERFAEIAMLTHLAQRGFIVISAEAYHLTYLKSDLPRLEWARWQQAGDALTLDYPDWCGIGKLAADTRLLLDMLESDPRVDKERIGIAGHSLGGKMAYYTGCIDPRVKVIMASDFGINYDQSNWHDSWYWGDKVKLLQAAGLEQWQLLDIANGKPFMLLAGQFDNMASFDSMQRSGAYPAGSEKLRIINHATGHRPPQDVLQQGYDFLQKYLQK